MTSRPDCPHWNPGAEPDAAHVASCAACRAALDELRGVDDALARVGAEPARPLGDLPRRLPVAPWEGAGHRAWGVVLAAVAVVAVIAATLFFAVGISPVAGIREAAGFAVWSRAAVGTLSGSFGTMVHAAPRAVQLAVAIGFVVINAILIAMLRRGPRGYDVRSR